MDTVTDACVSATSKPENYKFKVSLGNTVSCCLNIKKQAKNMIMAFSFYEWLFHGIWVYLSIAVSLREHQHSSEVKSKSLNIPVICRPWTSLQHDPCTIQVPEAWLGLHFLYPGRVFLLWQVLVTPLSSTLLSLHMIDTAWGSLLGSLVQLSNYFKYSFWF